MRIRIIEIMTNPSVYSVYSISTKKSGPPLQYLLRDGLDGAGGTPLARAVLHLHGLHHRALAPHQPCATRTEMLLTTPGMGQVDPTGVKSHLDGIVMLELCSGLGQDLDIQGSSLYLSLRKTSVRSPFLQWRQCCLRWRWCRSRSRPGEVVIDLWVVSEHNPYVVGFFNTTTLNSRPWRPRASSYSSPSVHEAVEFSWTFARSSSLTWQTIARDLFVYFSLASMDPKNPSG